MILFLGCSNTYGQGLSVERWAEIGYSQEYINSIISPDILTENMTYSDDEFRKKYHYPNLVAKHFNRPYGTKFGNGGNINDIIHILENYGRFAIPSGVEAVVIQFPDIQRNFDFMDLVKYSKFNETKIEANIISTISKIERWAYYGHSSNSVSSFENRFENPIPWFGFSWANDVAEQLKTNFSKNFVPLIYNDMEYDCMADLIELDTLSVKSKILSTHGIHVNEGHPSTDFHKIMADSVIKKIEKSNIKWEGIFSEHNIKK